MTAIVERNSMFTLPPPCTSSGGRIEAGFRRETRLYALIVVAIREAKLGEEPEIRSMYEWLFAPPGSRPPQWNPEAALERLREAIVSPQSTILVAESDGAMIGFCTLYLEFSSVRFGRRCWVEDLAVDPERRSLGVGAALLDAAKGWARSADATHLEL